MLNNFCVFEELVFFDLWILDSGLRIPDSGFRIPVSGFRFPIPEFGFRNPESGFRFPGFRVALLRAFGHRVAMCCNVLGVVGSSLKMVKFGPTTPNTSQHVATG